MRRRLVFAFVGLALSIIALYGVPRALMVADLIHETQTRQATRVAVLVAEVIAETGRSGAVTPDALERLLMPGEGATFADVDGVETHAGAGPADDGISVTVPVEGGGTLTLRRSAAIVTGRVAEAVAPGLLIGGGLMLVSWIAALLLARALSRPFVSLAETARAIGRGTLPEASEPLRIPEAKAIDEALRESAETLERRIRREHEFAANASHQLRTPITALRLELEDLSLWPETPPAVREQLDHALREIDRLADAIAQLLEMARGEAPSTGEVEPLDQVLRSAAARWTARAASAGREIAVMKTDAAALGGVPSAASQILDVLIHNALEHGRGTVRLGAARRAEYIVVQVADEGPRPSGNAIFRRRPEQRTAISGEGIGLALSAELAESLGGHLLLDGDETTTFVLILPVRA